VRLLATLTRQVAVVQYPSLSRSAVLHVELVQLAPNRLLLVLITDTGRVEQRVVELGHPAHRRRGRRPAVAAQLPAGRRALTDAPAVVADLPTPRGPSSGRC
jgi:heat-inducible transcriptional repressor